MVEKVKESFFKLAELREQKGIKLLGNLLLILSVIIMGLIICTIAYFLIADFLYNH
ncbi:hypothetical protein [Oceanobacillus picturae]|uniref:hypothetical protein n=1 Tax=Oceanobacillus picturae TaxID=171693 RepID=UPI000AD2E86B|nr:hypothetical protein [Oceanobacillus picturae]